MFDFEYHLPEERDEKEINSSTVKNSSSDENGTNSSAVESISHIEQPSGNLPPDGKKFKSFYAEQSKNKELGWSVKSKFFANNQENLVNNKEIHKKVSSQIRTIELDAKQGINTTKLNNNNRLNTKTKKFRAIINIQKSSSDSYESGTNNAEQSLEIALLNNPRLPGFLAGISDVYEKKTPERRKGLNKVIDDIYKEKGIIRDESDVEENGRVPLFSEYLLKHDTQEDFDAFLADEEFRNGFLLEYISNHTNKATGEIFYSAIDATTQAGLAWRTHLYHKYKQEYPTGGSDKLDKIKNSASTLNNVKNHIDRIVVDSICNGSNLKEGLDELFNVQKELAGRMTDSQKAALEEYNIPRLLRESIKIYFSMSENINVNHPLQKTGDNVFNLKLRSYLYLYAQQYSKFENKGGTLEDYEEELNKVLIAILVKDGKIDNAGYNEYLEEENALNNKMVQAQREARNRAIEWNRYANSNIRPGFQKESDIKSNKEGEGKLKYQEASGAEIAQEKNLSQNLDIKIKREPSETEKTFINKIAFRRACKDFILGNNDLKDFVSIGALQKFFIVGENGISFNQGVRDSFKLQWINKNGSNDLMKLNEIEAMLKGVFPVSFNKIKEGTIDLASNGMEKVDKIVKNHAIGAVIDNVKDVLDGLSRNNNVGQFSESFKYNENNPVEIKNDKMIISGFFGGNNIVVYYDTRTGDLSINSNINEDIESGEMTVGKDSPPKKIGTIASFDNILQDFYDTPTDEIGDSFFMTPANNGIYNNNFQNPVKNINQLPSRRLPVKKIMETNRLRLQKICGTQIDKIGSLVENELERNTQIDGIIYSLFRTLNIFSDNIKQEDKDNMQSSVILKNNTDLYKIIKMIQKSDSKTLNNFQNNMAYFMEILGLSWGKNNYKQNKERIGQSVTIFNDKFDGDNDIDYLRLNSENFDTEKNTNKQTKIFDKSVNYGILKILIDKFSKPGSNKFDSGYIEDYISRIKTILNYPASLDTI